MNPALAALDAALLALAPVRSIAGMERVPLQSAAGRILAQPFVSRVDLPATDVSAMDGYALCTRDLPGADPPSGGRIPVAGTVLAGMAGAVLAPGTALRIMTGAPVPAGADAVLPFEDALATGEGFVRVGPGLHAGANIRPRGEHVTAGETVLDAGTILAAPALGLLASLGAHEALVCPRLRVGVFSTGNELRDPPGPLEPGTAFDGNRPMLLAALTRAGFEPVDLGICADEPGVLESLLEAAGRDGIGVLLSTGGAAAGDADHIRRLPGARLVEAGVRPGRGVVVVRGLGPEASLRLLGLPGNPVAAWTLLHLLVLPALRRIAGADCGLPEPIEVALAQDARVRAGRIDLRRARIVRGPEGPSAQFVPHQGAAMLRGLCEADAIVAIGPEAEIPAGMRVPAWLLGVLS